MSALDALVYDLTIPQGVDWPGVSYPLVGQDGLPYDLTGCSALGQIRPHPGSDELYFTWSTSPSTGQGLITLDVENSTLTIRVLGTESAPWFFATGSYDVVLSNPSAPVGLQTWRVAMGTVTVSLETTVLP